MTLPNDYSRCHGTEAYVCQSCERRRQIERDSPDVWYPYMPPAETGGRCNYKIEGSMSTHYVCGCTSEDCRVNGCLMKRQRNESARFYSTDSADCGCSTRTGGSMNIKVLTDERIKLIWKETRASMGVGGDPVLWFARAIEQAVLQSPKVRGLLNALQEVVDAADGDGWNVLDPSFEKQRAALAAFAQEKS